MPGGRAADLRQHGLWQHHRRIAVQIQFGTNRTCAQLVAYFGKILHLNCAQVRGGREGAEVSWSGTDRG